MTSSDSGFVNADEPASMGQVARPGQERNRHGHFQSPRSYGSSGLPAAYQDLDPSPSQVHPSQSNLLSLPGVGVGGTAVNPSLQNDNRPPFSPENDNDPESQLNYLRRTGPAGPMTTPSMRRADLISVGRSHAH